MSAGDSGAGAGAGVIQTGHAGACLEITGQKTLPPALASAKDIRLADDGSVRLLASLAGLFDLESAVAVKSARLRIASGNRSSEVWFPWHLGLSERWLAAAGPVYWAGWMPVDGSTLSSVAAFDSVVDLDLGADQLLVAGARRDEDANYAPKGTILWRAELATTTEAEFQPIFHSSAGPGARPMDYCGQMGLTTVRWLPTGQLLFVPGFEPGVFLLDASGETRRVWNSADVGFDAGCGLDEAEAYRYSADYQARWAWAGQRRIVDEVLPLADGPGLLIRTVGAGRAQWQLVRLDLDGGVRSRCAVPIADASELSFLRGDVQGDQILLLVEEHGSDSRGKVLAPRLLRARLR